LCLVTLAEALGCSIMPSPLLIRRYSHIHPRSLSLSLCMAFCFVFCNIPCFSLIQSGLDVDVIAYSGKLPHFSLYFSPSPSFSN
jgi:hypothetical protein